MYTYCMTLPADEVTKIYLPQAGKKSSPKFNFVNR